jgi:O-antigen/teichoic acid export membrane protein
VAVLLSILAPYLVVFLYGDQWGPSAYVLRFLTVLMIVRMLTSLAFDILTSLGATRSTVWLNAGWAVVLIPALWFGTHLDNIRGAAIAHSIVAVAVALPLAVIALHRAGVPLLPVLPALVRPAAGAALCAAVTLLAVRLIDGGVFLHLFVPGAVGMLVFVLTVVPVEQFRQLRTRLVRAR